MGADDDRSESWLPTYRSSKVPLMTENLPRLPDNNSIFKLFVLKKIADILSSLRPEDICIL
jgi:hypothetical protein